MKILNLYSGRLRPFGPRGKNSGIFKSPVDKVQVDKNGMVTDVQADSRFHGGPEKALHQYALSSYEAIIKRHPLLHKKALPGSIGENISSNVMNDNNVCIGDIYQMGDVKVQVSSPRIPCWKISHKLETNDLDKFIQKTCITGWYYRVQTEGELKIGDNIELLERPNPELTVKSFMQVVNGLVDDTNSIKQAANATGLDPEWKQRLNRKILIKLSDGEKSDSDYTL